MEDLALTTETIQAGGKPTAVMVLTGYLDTYTAPNFIIALEGAIDEGAVHVVLDVSSLDYMGSAGFGALAGANHRGGDRGGKLVVAGLSEKLKGVFDNLGLSALVEAAADRQAAIESLR